MPPELAALGELVMDLRWTWSHRGDEVWSAIDHDYWERTANPYALLAAVSDERLDALSRDQAFLDKLARLAEARQHYRRRDTWWAAQPRTEQLRGAAYFSMEFGLSNALPTYAGGLGVLAGDYLKAASDMGFPMYGIGLLYHQGYFRQRLDASGWQQAIYTYNAPGSLPLEPARAIDGSWLSVDIELPGRPVRLRVWQAQVGRALLYLLDSNDPWNAPVDRGITNILYGGNQEQRLLQEIALGVGGWSLVEALQLPVDICHLNEGHAALAAVERAHRYQRRHQLSFTEALWATRPGNVFTTHTPVPAGFDAFPRELVLTYGRRYAQTIGLDEAQVMAMGRDGDADADTFNMAFLAARCCATVNGVSRRHGEVSRRIFAPLYPRWPLAEVPVGYVTNGVHMPSWDSPGADALWTGACGADRWLGDTGTHEAAIACASDEALWALKGRDRDKLVHYARRRLKRQLGQRGLSAAEVEIADYVLDPNVLTLGFARRFTEYKRPNLLLTDTQRLMRLLLDPHRPVQLLVAGKAHPADESGKRYIQDWIRFAQQPELRGRVVFLEDYDLEVAEALVQGVDVWINTPRAPLEACGTSGMKVLVNGGLNLSVLDGWWAEAYAPDVGWAVDAGDAAPSDAADAACLFDLLEQQLVPLFYERDADGLPRGWISRIRASLSRLTPQFSTNRMLREYVERLYRPAAAAAAARQANDAQAARQLNAAETRLRQHWPRVHLGSLKAAVEAAAGQVSVDVYLGELEPADVDVQLYADAAAGRPQAWCASMRCEQPIPGTANGYLYRLELPPQGRIDEFTPRIVARLQGAWQPQELPLICWP